MNSLMLEFYLIISIFVGMVWYAGFEGTLRLFYYIELQLKFLPIRIRLYFMHRRMQNEFKHLFGRYSDDGKSNKN